MSEVVTIDHAFPVEGPKRWAWNGSTVKPTTSPSIMNRWRSDEPGIKPQVCHYFIRDGQIQYCGDCTHDLAGKTMLCEPSTDPNDPAM